MEGLGHRPCLVLAALRLAYAHENLNSPSLDQADSYPVKSQVLLCAGDPTVREVLYSQLVHSLHRSLQGWESPCWFGP